VSEKCRDAYERPGCLIEADERYTMRFDDIGEPPIYWCATCGPETQRIDQVLTEKLRSGGEKFAEQYRDAIDAAASTVVKH
jgi:hypothetical protein